MKPQRYSPTDKTGEMRHDDEGGWVTYDDLLDLQEKRDKAADELARSRVQVIELTDALQQAMATLRGIRDSTDRDAAALRSMADSGLNKIMEGGINGAKTEVVAGPRESRT